MYILLLNYTLLKFENLVFVIIPTRENIRLFARTPFQGNTGTLKCPKYGFRATSSEPVDGF